MIRNAKYIRIKLLKSFSTNWEGLTGGAALEVEKELQKERWDTAKGRFCGSWRGVCPLKACWELASPVGTGVVLYDPGGGGKGEDVCQASLSCSAENHSEKPPLNTHPTSMG